MPPYPAKPYVVPHDEWFNNNSSNFENKPKAKDIKGITSIHEFFYKQSSVKVGGSDNLIQTTLEKKSSEKNIISSHQNSNESLSLRNVENIVITKSLQNLNQKKLVLFKQKQIIKICLIKINLILIHIF